MGRDRSLTEFGTDEAVERTPPGPQLEITYRWDGAGIACAACGHTSDRLWRDEAGLVCPDCKGW